MPYRKRGGRQGKYWGYKMGKTKIEWSEVTWNPVLGCSMVSAGCTNCYAMVMSARIANAAIKKLREGKDLTSVEEAYLKVVKWEMRDDPPAGMAVPKWSGELVPVPDRFADPMRWQKPRLVFVNSMSDLFHENIPYDVIDQVFAVMAMTPHHTYQVLTKRTERAAEYFNKIERGYKITQAWWNNFSIKNRQFPRLDHKDNWPLRNVWIGTSVENQKAADERIPHLLEIPSTVRFLSCEPLLGPVDIKKYLSEIDWVIVGGESGHNARPMHPDWARSLRDQSINAGVPFHFKQWGEWYPAQNWGEKPRVAGRTARGAASVCFIGEGKNTWRMTKAGKKQSGRLLGGMEWNQIPDRA